MHSAVYQVSWSQESTDAPQQNEELKTRMVVKNNDLCMDQPAHHWSKDVGGHNAFCAFLPSG